MIARRALLHRRLFWDCADLTLTAVLALAAAGGGRGGGVCLFLLVKLDRDRLEQHPLAVGAVVVRVGT